MREMCSTKGFLSFLILWLFQRKTCICGEDIAREIGRRRGGKPSPGTIYPALAELKKKGLIRGKKEGRRVCYCLTPKGEKEFLVALEKFRKMFGDLLS